MQESSPWYEFPFYKISCETSEIRNSNNLVVHSNILLCFNLTLNIKKMSYKRDIIIQCSINNSVKYTMSNILSQALFLTDNILIKCVPILYENQIFKNILFLTAQSQIDNKRLAALACAMSNASAKY